MNSWLKQQYVVARRYLKCVRLLGMPGLSLILRTLAGSRAEVACQVQGAQVWVRLNTTDIDTLIQIFLNNEYELDLPREPRIIIDAGANVGYAAIYFALRYPSAAIYALEPETQNFSQLEKHGKGYPQITPIKAALWHEDAAVNLVDAGEGAWGFRVSEGDGGEQSGEVSGIGVETLMQRYALQNVDLFKIDIEGSEKELFEHSKPWIDRVDALVVELHDKYRVGCARAFYNATNDFAQEARIGENIFLAR